MERIINYSEIYHNSQPPDFFRQKPQIASIPGISTKERNRYRVVFGTEILGDQLAIDDALKLAKGGKA